MADYISREAVLALADDFEMMLADGTDEIFFEYIPIDKVRSLQAADVRPVVRGRWIKCVGENGVTSACRCSLCGFEDNRFSVFNYCPNCGADMREES